MSQTPAVCRFVQIAVDPAINNGADFAPAVITRVWTGGIVNVRVLLDGPETPWRTSVRVHESREAAEAWHAENSSGPLAHIAWWPPRV